MDDEFEQAERRAERVRAESQGRGGGEEAVHDVERVRREADEEEQLGAFLDRAHDALDRERAGEPSGDAFAEEGAGEGEDGEGADERGEVGDDGAGPGSVGVAGEDYERRV